MTEWLRSDVETLIQMYQHRPCLWDFFDTSYSDKTARHNAYEEIVAEFKEDFPDVNQTVLKNKIHNMRTRFRKELRKLEFSERHGVPYKPKLWYYESLSFLKHQRSRIPNTDVDFPTAVIPPSSVESFEEGCGDQQPPQNGWCSPEKDEDKHDEIFKEPEVKKKRSNNMPTDLSAFNKSYGNITILNTPKSMDDCAAMGTYVSEKLRKMDELQQILAEALIQKVVTRGLKRQLTEETIFFGSPTRQ